MEIILDTSFILTCLKEKIDFFGADEYGELVLPSQVIDELKRLIDKKTGKDRDLAILALEIIQDNKKKFKSIELGSKHVDAGIKGYVSGNKGKKIIVATMDSGLKKDLKGKVKVLIVRAKKKLVLI